MNARVEIAPGWSQWLTQTGRAPVQQLLHQPPDAVDLPGHWQQLSKPGLVGRERWRWEYPGDPPAVFFLKRYQRPRFREQWDRLLRQNPRHSRGWWEYAVARRLADAGIAVARPVGYAEQMAGLWERASTILLERVPGDALDRTWRALTQTGSPLTRGLARFDLTRRLARFIAAFHGAGLCHRDLYLCHIFAELDDTLQTPPAFCLIDLARAHAPRWRRLRWFIKDLSQLEYSARQVGATRTDRWRFLRTYLGLQARSPRLRWYARKVRRKADRIQARDIRKGRA